MSNSKYWSVLKKYDKSVSDYLSSDFIATKILEVASKYNVSTDLLNDIFIDFICTDFKFGELKKLINTKSEIAANLKNGLLVDFIGLVYLPIAKNTNYPVEKELANLGSSMVHFEKIIQDYRQFILSKEVAELKEKLNKEIDTVDIDKEARETLDFFSRNLRSVLTEKNEESITLVNSGLIMLLFNKEGFSDSLAKVLFNSNEILTDKNLVLNNKVERGTTANWLKDFIAQKGGGVFSSIDLSSYLSNSTNLKNLSMMEKELIRKLLIFYRSVKFFSKDFNFDKLGNWQVIPIEQKDQGVLNELNQPNIKKEQQVAVQKVEVKSVGILKQSPETEKRMAELMSLANSYPAGSLERRAIEEEIKKLS